MNDLYNKAIAQNLSYWSASKEGREFYCNEACDAIVILIDDVVDYYQKNDDFTGAINANDYPNIRPPFNSMFFESAYRHDLWIDAGLEKIGVLLTERMVDEEGGFYTLRPFALTKNKQAITLDVEILVLYKNNGAPDPSFDDATCDGRKSFIRAMVRDIKKGDDEFIGSIVFAHIPPVLLALSFMHCKNVKLIENDPNEKLPSRVRKHWKKKNKEPLKKYYTLNIEPMKEVIRKEGDIEHNGLKQALHICRGHFKDYSQGKGLFGKYKGLYWWDMQARGNVKEGIVLKDYKVTTGVKEVN